MNARGFTLLELIITITLIALLVGLATPALQSHLEASHRTAAKLRLLDLMAAQRQHHLRNNTYTTDIDELSAAESHAEKHAFAAHACPPDIKSCVRLTATRDGDETLTLESNGTRLPRDEWRR